MKGQLRRHRAVSCREAPRKRGNSRQNRRFFAQKSTPWRVRGHDPCACAGGALSKAAPIPWSLRSAPHETDVSTPARRRQGQRRAAHPRRRIGAMNILSSAAVGVSTGPVTVRRIRRREGRRRELVDLVPCSYRRQCRRPECAGRAAYRRTSNSAAAAIAGLGIDKTRVMWPSRHLEAHREVKRAAPLRSFMEESRSDEETQDASGRHGDGEWCGSSLDIGGGGEESPEEDSIRMGAGRRLRARLPAGDDAVIGCRDRAAARTTNLDKGAGRLNKNVYTTRSIGLRTAPGPQIDGRRISSRAARGGGSLDHGHL